MSKTLRNLTMLFLIFVMLTGLISAFGFIVNAQTGYGSNGKFLSFCEEPDEESIAISNRVQLEAIKDNLSGKYHLTSDIDLSDVEWVPLGNDWSSPFTGIFDGQGYVVRNLKISGVGYQFAGLFGLAVDNSIIKNVGMEGTNIDMTNNFTFGGVGGVCGAGYGGSITNCYNTGQCTTPKIKQRELTYTQ